MMDLIKNAILETKFDASKFEPITDDDLVKLYRLSSAHTVDHIVGYALKNNNLLSDSDVSKLFNKKIILAAYQYGKMEEEIAKISEALNKGNVEFINLKGTRIRQYYPEPFLRNSCDIDILIHEKDLQRATAILYNHLCYAVGEKEYHDVHLYSPNGVHLELHFNIQEKMPNLDKLLSKVWKNSMPKEENSYEYVQNNEFFIFHNIAHMVYHFIGGGCGVRPFLDLLVLRKNLKYDESVLKSYLKKCEIDVFYENVLKLTDVWFGDSEHTDLTKNMEEYILRGGVYGNQKNRIAVDQIILNSKTKYIKHRIFLSYDELKISYPNLIKHKWLLPFYQVCRWFRKLTKGKIKDYVQEIKVNNEINDLQREKIKSMLEELKLYN